MATQTDLLKDALAGYNRNDITSIIDRLAGDKDSLRVDLKHVRFSLHNERFDVNGVVDFKIVHKIPNAHAVVKEIVKKYG